MLTDEELDHPYLNPGVPTSVDFLLRYWELVLERKVEREEVEDALRRQSERWCLANPVECAENIERIQSITREPANVAFWRSQRV